MDAVPQMVCLPDDIHQREKPGSKARAANKAYFLALLSIFISMVKKVNL